MKTGLDRALKALVILLFWSAVACTNEHSTSGDATVAPRADQVRPLLPGARAPSFAARRPDNSDFLFNPDALEKPVIITFYRGGWCPYCTRYLMDLRHVEPELLNMGFDLLFLSADSPDTLSAALEEVDVEYIVLSDNDLDVAKAFGVAFHLDAATYKNYVEHGHDLEGASDRTHHNLPVPATFVIGTNGTIEFVYANPNYKVRLAPEVLIAAAQVTAAREKGD